MPVFFDAEESPFYAACVRRFVLATATVGGGPHRIVECGSGTGKAIAEMVTGCPFEGRILGFEADLESFEVAWPTIERLGVSSRYSVSHGDFFAEVGGPPLDCVISNPPYLPAPDRGWLKAPQLWGGADGSCVSRRILARGFHRALLMVSSYSNPVGVIRFARRQGYRVAAWVVKPLPFGEYSSEPIVQERIEAMAADGTALVSATGYWLAGVLWTRSESVPDDSSALVRALTSAPGG